MTEVTPSFADRTDFENASKGLIDSLSPCVIKNPEGRVIWDNDSYSFLQKECPPTANPKLWRQGQLCSIQGLFEVTKGIYQVRGLDVSNMTIIEGKTGVIIIDTLVSIECAAAALALYRKNRGDRKVSCLMYSHSHIDHFGGARGVLPQGSDPKIPIVAPEGFMEEVTSENIFAGNAMRLRASFMYGGGLPKGPESQIGCGLGMTTSSGTTSVLPPNLLITKTGEEHVIDGVRVVFQLVPDTEAPCEMNFFFPDHKALCISECATHSLHNIITLRGALVRDAKAWSCHLDETMNLYGQQSDVLFAGHHWPTWEKNNIVKMISEQRDMYAYLHDQTLRMMNLGMNGPEIAETLTLPPGLASQWHTQGFYGSVSHNVKGIYQRYMTWFDGNPAHLWQYPPAEEGKRYVECMGGIDAILAKAEKLAEAGDLRFASTLLSHANAADPTHEKTKKALASVFDKLAWGAENGTWRNFYLTGAKEIRKGKKVKRNNGMSGDNPILSVDQWLDSLAVQIDGPRAAAEKITIDLHLPDQGRRWRVTLSNGALTQRSIPEKETFGSPAALALKLDKPTLGAILQGRFVIQNQMYEGDVELIYKMLSFASVARPKAQESKL